MAAAPPVHPGQQGKHLLGHPNRIPKKTAWAPGVDHVSITQEAWLNGSPVPGQPQARSYHVGYPIGENGETWVKVHYSPSSKTIHGHPFRGPQSGDGRKGGIQT